jgi:flavin-dependent dehydrogenase
LNSDRYDVVIVGGGPAGAVAGMACAVLGLRTIVLEAATEPRWKPGEVLAPECNPILKELGLWALLDGRPESKAYVANVAISMTSAGVFFPPKFLAA